MAEDNVYADYLKETVAGAQVCVYCKKSVEEIGDRIEGHASWCKWRKDMEEQEKKRGRAEERAEDTKRLKSMVKRYER